MISGLTDEIRFLLDPMQSEICDWFLRQLSQVVCVLGARGAGKSGLLRAIILMVCISSRKQVLYASQSSGNSLDQFNKLVDDETVKKFLYEGNDKEAFTTKPIPTIRWKNGSETLFWSLEDHVSKRGLHPHVLIADEGQSLSETSWSRVLYPMRVRVGGGARLLVFGSTPDTDGHWFWRLHQKGLDFPNDAGVKSFTMNTENALAFKGTAGKKVLAEAKATMADHDFKSEFGLKPGGQGNHYFNPADIDACVAAYDHNSSSLAAGTLMALDPSLGSHDPMAYVIWDLRGNVILSHSIDMEMSDTDQVREVIDMTKKYQSLLVIEANSTAFMTYSGSMKLLLPYGCREIPLRSISTKAGEAKNSLCKQFAWQMEHKQIHFSPECKTLIKQLKSLRDYKLPSGALQIRAPEKEHDDEAFAAIIGAEAFAKGWSPDLDVRGDPAMGLI